MRRFAQTMVFILAAQLACIVQAAENLPPALRASLDADVWPDVTPEIWKVNARRQPPDDTGAVTVRCRGMTVEPLCAVAGGRITLRADYEGDIPPFPFKTRVMFIHGGRLAWDDYVWIREESVLRYSDRFWRIELPYVLPVCLDSRRLTARLEAPKLRLEGGHPTEAEFSYRRVRRIPGWEKPVVACVTNVAGYPRFMLDGKPTFPLWGATVWNGRADRTPRHSSAPLNFVTVWADHLKWWPRGEVFNPVELDRIAEHHVRAYPDAFFMWDISIYPPPDWREANPDEMARDEHGNINRDVGDDEINYSFASKKAIDAMERMMEKTIRYLEQSPYADRIVGYRINSGHTIEWLGWSPTKKDSVLDFSPVAQRGFEAFARANYPEVTDFSVPKLSERQALDDGELLWDQRRHARTVAYHDFYSTAIADVAIRMCRRAKEILGGRKLVGTYYGYVLTLNDTGASQMRAHYATKRFLDAHPVDFVMSPQSYTIRRLGGTCGDMKPFKSFTDHGIVSVIENDTRTYNMMSRRTQLLTEAHSVAVLRRDMGIALCRCQPFYTYALCGGADFDFPAFAHDAAELRFVAEHALANRSGRHAEIAYVVSEESIKAQPMLKVPPDRYDEGWQSYCPDGTVERDDSTQGVPTACEPYRMIYTRLSRIGAPVDCLLAEDLADNPGDYKFYIFGCCSKPTPALVKAMAAVRKRPCTILWTGAPGYVSRDGNSLANMKALTGADFGRVEGAIDPGVRMKDGTFAGVTRNPVAPVFFLKNPDEVFGVYTNGLAGLAAVKTDSARTVFCGSHRVELPFLRRLAAEAGVFIYSDSTDPMEASNCFFTLHARFGGRKTVRLPRKTNVYDVFSRRVVAKNADVFSFDAPLFTSHLFYFGDDAESLPPDAR